MDKVQAHQAAGAWLEEQWNTPEALKKIAAGRSSEGILWGMFGKTYESAAKLMLKSVIDRGCQYASAQKIFDTTKANILARKKAEAFQDIEQTCSAFYDHFGKMQNTASCISNFAFCLHFHVTVSALLLRIPDKVLERESDLARFKVKLVETFLFKTIVNCTNARGELAKAFHACDEEFCTEILRGSQGYNDVVLPFSNLGGGKQGRLVAQPRWEIFFTMVLLETTVASRLGKVMLIEPIHQRQIPFLCTLTTNVSSRELSDIVAKARDDGCFDAVLFTNEAFISIVTRMYGFPLRADKIDVDGFFNLATQCGVASEALFASMFDTITRGRGANSSNTHADFIVSFLRKLRRWMLLSQLPNHDLFVRYFRGFLPLNALHDNVHGVYAPLLEDGALAIPMRVLAADVLQSVQTRQKPLALGAIVHLLKEVPAHDNPLKRDELVLDICLHFFDDRRNQQGARAAGYNLVQYGRDMGQVLELARRWDLDFSRWGQKIAARVAFDASSLLGHWANFAGQPGQRIATVCAVVSDPNFCALVDSANPEASMDLDRLLNELVDGLDPAVWFQQHNLNEFLNKLSPTDDAMNPRNGAADSAAHVVWLKICGRLGNAVTSRPPAEKTRLLKQLAIAGPTQLAQQFQDAATSSGEATTRQLSFAVYYTQVLLLPTLAAAGFDSQDQPKWKTLLGAEILEPVTAAVRMFNEYGIRSCTHPLARQHLRVVDDIATAMTHLKEDFGTHNMSMQDALPLKDAVKLGGPVRRVLDISEEDIDRLVEDHQRALDALRDVLTVVRFLGRFNVDEKSEQDINQLIGQSHTRGIEGFISASQQYVAQFKTACNSLGVELFELVLHFQQEDSKSVVFEATVRSRQDEDRIGLDDKCEIEDVKELLEQVDGQLAELLACTLTTDKLVPILKHLKNCDIPAEIEVLRGWRSYAEGGERAAQDIKRCMELLQKVENIAPILDTLRKYEMTCEDDDDAAKLRDIARKFAPGEQGMMLRRVPESCAVLNDIFTGLGPTHFKFIETIKDADHLITFLNKDAVDGKDFYTPEGKRNYAERKRLVDAQIEASASRDHHGRLLNAFEINAMPVCECFATMSREPLRHAIQTIAGIQRLKDVDDDARTSIDSLCKQIKMANDNIQTIKGWFTRSQVSTFENAQIVMENVKQTGKVHIELQELIAGQTTFKIRFKQGEAGAEEGIEEVLTVDDVDELQRQLTFSLQQQDNAEQAQAADQAKAAEGKASLQVLQLLRTIFDQLQALQASGHPFYQKRTFEYSVKTNNDDRVRLRDEERKLAQDLNSWEAELRQAREETKQLQLLTSREISIVVHLLSEQTKGPGSCVSEMVQTLLGKDVDISSAADVDLAVHFCIANLLGPIRDIAEALLDSDGIKRKTDEVKQLLYQPGRAPLYSEQCSAEEAVEYTLITLQTLVGEVFKLPVSINTGDCGQQYGLKVEEPSEIFAVLLQHVFVPEQPTNSQILWCTAATTDRDIALFFQRIRSFRRLHFVVCGIGRLTQYCREKVYEHQQVLHRDQSQVNGRHANVTYVSLGASTAVGSSAAFIKDRGIQRPRPSHEAQWPRAGSRATLARYEQVCALVGDSGSGKTHRLKALRREEERKGKLIQVLSLVDEVDSGFVSRKLAALEFQRALAGDVQSSVFLNVSDVVAKHHSKVDVDRTNFFYDVNRLLFEALVLGYTQQAAGGATFTLADQQMNIFVEVPARQRDADGDLVQDDYLAMMPVLQIFAASSEVLDPGPGYSGPGDPDSEYQYEIQIPSSDQNVAIMLNALHTENSRGRMIDKVANYNDGHQETQVKLQSVDSPDECRRIVLAQLTDPAQIRDISRLDVRVRGRKGAGGRLEDMSEEEYMAGVCAKIARSKLLQACFLAYLGRRCAYYFTPNGAYTTNGDPAMKLGTTTGRQFIRESIELCDNDHNVDDHGEYLLLGEGDCLAMLRKDHKVSRPELARLVEGTDCDIDEELFGDLAAFKKMAGQNIEMYSTIMDPSSVNGLTQDEYKRRLEQRWPHYIARGLGFGGNAKQGHDQVKKVLDEMNFVMVSDFCFKICHIHERKLAKLPVIIEGETGVGKTYLLDCYANLLASQLRRTAKEPPRQIVRMCGMMKELCAELQKYITGLGPQADQAAQLAMGALEARHWQLQNETTAKPGAGAPERARLPIEAPTREDASGTAAMFGHWEWLCSIGCPDAAHGAEWAWLAPESREHVKQLCVARFVEIVLEWRQIPLLDLGGEFDGLERRPPEHTITSEFDERTRDDVPRRWEAGKLGRTPGSTFQEDVAGWLDDSNDKLVTESKLVFRSFRTCGSIPLFYRLMVHPGITPDDVQHFLAPVRTLAEILDGTAEGAKEVDIVCFFDEVNTAECQGLFKEILYDRSIGGEPLGRNLFFIAAINPDNKIEAEGDDAHLAFINGTKALSVKSIHRDVYVVNKMHPVLKALKWNYTKLGEDNLELYIHHKVSSYQDGGRVFSAPTQRLLSQLINASQNFMVNNLGESSVSQRDVQRCFSLIKFFRQHAPVEMHQQGEEKLMQSAVVLAASVAYYFRLPTEVVIGLDKLPILLREHYVESVKKVYPKFKTTIQECLFSFVTRENFAIPEGIALNQALQENIFCMVAALETKIPVSIIGLPGSSKTLSFQIVQRNLRGPSLSPTAFCRQFKEIEAKFYQCNEYSTEDEIASVFDRAIERQNELDSAAGRGEESTKRCVVFLDEASLPDEKKMVLKVLHPYLDEHRVAAVVISNVPLDAANANRLIEVHRGVGTDADLQVLAKGCLGVESKQITEAMGHIVTGLCKGYKRVLEESKETLVEANLEPGDAARVHDLDGTSGAVWMPQRRDAAGNHVQMPVDDVLARRLNQATATIQYFDVADQRYCVFINVGDELFEARLHAQHLRRIELVKRFRTFHFRDFIYLLRHINRSNKTGQPMTNLSPEILLEALECNFGGIQPEEFEELAEMFFSAIAEEQDAEFVMPEEKLRSPLEVFRNSLEDAKAVASKSDTYSELHPRFKLIIDESEDDSAARLLETVGIQFTKVFRMSDFPADNTSLHYARLISDIKMSMERGDTILLIDTDRIHGSFYDLFNQNYDAMEGDRGEKMLFSNVAVGAASHKCRVHKDFQCVVHMREQDLKSKPAPFLSRFEKYRLSIRDFMNAQREAISGMTASKMEFVYARVQSFVDHILPKHFLGFGASTLASLFMSHVQSQSGTLTFQPFSRWTEGNRDEIYDASKDQSDGQQDVFVFIQALCARLLQLVPPEVAMLYIKDGLGTTKGMFGRAYFHTQEHVDFRSLVQKLIAHGRDGSVNEDCIAAAKKTVVMTRSALDVKRFDSAQLQNYLAPALADVIDVARLERYKSSSEFEDKLDRFMASDSKEMLVVVADGSLTSTKHLNYVRHLLDQVKLTAAPEFTIHDEPEPEPEPEPDLDYAAPTRPKQFVLLLHFAPESILTRQDYPTVFLAGWDYIYIDSTATHEAGSAKTLTSILAGKVGQDDGEGGAADVELIKFDQLFGESLWRFCSQVDIGHRANAAASEEMVQLCQLYASDADPGKREQAFKRVLDNADAAQLRKTIREVFFQTFEGEGGKISELMEEMAKDIVSGKHLRGLADLCHFNLLDQFSAHCVPFFLALANDFGLVSIGKLSVRVITEVVAPMLAGISSDDVLAASSLTVTWKVPTCYTLPLIRIVSARVKRVFDAEVIKVRDRSRDDVGASYIQDQVRDRLHKVLQRDPVCKVFAKPGEIAPDLLPEVCRMYAQDAVRNIFPQTGQDDEHVAEIVRGWLLCGFSSDDVSTDILTHVMMALEPSLDTDATGFKKLNAICQALKKLAGNNDEVFDIGDRDAFVDRLENHLNTRLWEVMSSLVDDALDMNAWERRLADWLAAYEFVSRHFPPGKKGTKKERHTWHAMSAVRVIVRSPAVDSAMRQECVKQAISKASDDRGEAKLCTVRTLIDETVALFGDNEVAKRGLLGEIVMWWTEATIKHKAAEEDFRTCLGVVNGSDAAHGIALLPSMAAFLLERLCECAAPGWPKEDKDDGSPPSGNPDDVRALNAEERAAYDELEAVLCEEMARPVAAGGLEPQLAKLLFNKIVHGNQKAMDDKPGGITAQDVIGCLQQMGPLNERADRDPVQLIKKEATERWMSEAAGRYCALPFGVHAADEMESGNSLVGAAMVDILGILTPPEAREGLLIFMHAIEQRAGPNHLQALLKEQPFDPARYPWVKPALDQLELEVDPSGAKYARQLPFAFASEANPHPEGMLVEISTLYTEFSACFEECAIADPPEFKPLADFCVAKVAATPAQAAHLKMCVLVKVYYDHYSNERLEKLAQLREFVRGAQLQCLGATPGEQRLLLCVLEPATIAGYDSETNHLAKVFRLDNDNADDLLLRDILVNLAAVAIGAGPNHHLFTHIFSPEQLHGTWGFIAGAENNIDASHYDCGCKIKENGAVENDRVSAEAVLMGISTCFGGLCWTLLCDGDPNQLANWGDQILSRPTIQGMADDQGFAGANMLENTCHFVVAHVNMTTRFLKIGALEPSDKFMVFYNQCLGHFFVEAAAGAYTPTYAGAEPRAQAEAAWEQRVVAKALATYPEQEEHIAAVRQEKAKELGDHVDEDRTHIVENILTLKCPRCTQAFDVFSGCFALTCSRADCACGFCAWCLADCGGDAHAHVLTCPSNPQQGSYNGDDAGFAACNLARREVKVPEYLMTLDEDRRKRVAQRCRTDFEHVQLAGVLARFCGGAADEQDGALLPEIAKAGQAQDVQVTYPAFLSALQNGRYADADTPHILKEFANKRRSLQLMDQVIPIAKLYFFIHENLGHMYSEAESRDISLQDAVQACAEDLVPASLSKRKRKAAKERIVADVNLGIEAVNTFHRVEGGTLQPGACDETQRFDPIGDETKLLYVLTDPKHEGGPNILFHIVRYLVSTQNKFFRYCADRCSADPVISMDFAAVGEEEVSIFDVLATSGGLLSVTDDTFESICPAFCSENPVLRSKLMSLAFDFQQCQRFATSLLAGYSIVSEASLGTVFAFKTNRAVIDEAGQLVLQDAFCEPMENVALEEVRARLGGLSEEALQQCNTALEKYLLSMLRSEPAYSSDNADDPDLLRLRNSTIGDYAAARLGDIADFDCQQALAVIEKYQMRFLRAIALQNSQRYDAATGANKFAGMTPAFRKPLNPQRLEAELLKLFDDKVHAVQPDEADNQGKVDLLENATKFLCEICADDTSGIEGQVLMPLTEYCAAIGYEANDDALLFTETGHDLPAEIKVENITEVCTILFELRQQYARRALDNARSVPWRELEADFVEPEPEPEPDSIVDFEPEPAPEDDGPPPLGFEPEDPSDSDSDIDGGSDDNFGTPIGDDPAQLVPTRSQRDRAEEEEEEGEGLFGGAMQMETPEARAQREQEEEDSRAREEERAQDEARRQEASSEAGSMLEEGQELKDRQDLEGAIEQYKEALALDNLKDEELIEVVTKRLLEAQAAMKSRDAARAAMQKLLEEGQQFVAANNFDSAVAALQKGVDMAPQCHDTGLSKRLTTEHKTAQTALQQQTAARAAADRDFKHAEEAMQTGNHDAALAMYTGALTHAVNDDARQQKFNDALQACEKEMASSEYVIADVELTFEDSSEAFEDKSEFSTEPLVPWGADGAVPVQFQFWVHAIGGREAQTLKAPPAVCKSIVTLQQRIEKTMANPKKKTAFEETDEVVLLNPGHVALSKDIPATWPSLDLASRGSTPAGEGKFAVQIEGKEGKEKRVFGSNEAKDAQPLYAATRASLASVDIELDAAYREQSPGGESISLQLAETATWRSVIGICVQHFGIHELSACCLKRGDEILELGAACGKIEGQLVLAPATKEAVVSLVRSEQLPDGQKETKKLSSTVNSSGQSVLSFMSLMKVVAEFPSMSELKQTQFIAWSDDTQSAQSEGELCEGAEKVQRLGIAKASDVLSLSFSLEFAGQDASAVQPRQCLPDTQVGAASKQVLSEAGLDPSQCLVLVDGADSQDTLDLDAPTTAADLATSGALSLHIHPGAALVGCESLHKVSRGQTIDQLREELGLEATNRLGDIQTHIVPSPDELVEVSWRKNMRLGAVRTTAVCTVSVTGQDAAPDAISFVPLATIAHVRKAFELSEVQKLAWKHCVLPTTATLEMVLQIDNDGTEDDDSPTLSLTTTSEDPKQLQVLAPASVHVRHSTAKRYAVGVIEPHEANFAAVKQTACLYFGLPHACFDLGASVDTSDGSEGTEFHEDDSMVSEFFDEFDEEDTSMALPLERSSQASEIECELRTGEGTDVVTTKPLLIDTAMPFRRVRSYAKQAFALESSHLDAEHGCVAIGAPAAGWMQLVLEEDYQEADEDDYGETFEGAGGRDVVQLHVLGELRSAQPDSEPEPEPEPEMDGTPVSEPEPEPEPEPSPEPETEMDTPDNEPEPELAYEKEEPSSEPEPEPEFANLKEEPAPEPEPEISEGVPPSGRDRSDDVNV